MALDPREIPVFATDATAKLARHTLVSESTVPPPPPTPRTHRPLLPVGLTTTHRFITPRSVAAHARPSLRGLSAAAGQSDDRVRSRRCLRLWRRNADCPLDPTA